MRNNKGQFIKGFNGGKLGMRHTEETKKKIRTARARQGSNVWNKGTNKSGMKGKHHSEELKRKSSFSQSGEKNHAWRGGSTAIVLRLRHSLEYRLWRVAVFERDDYICIWCGVKGGKLEADHIKPFALFPELRFAIDNGRTLCVECHRTTDTYG